MISIESIAFIKQLIASREIEDYYFDIFKMYIPSNQRNIYTDGFTGFYYLLTHELPIGTIIASEISALQIDDNWANKTITKIHEFSGQLRVYLPENANIKEIEFARAIPRK